jgi:hypothetical protein
MIENRDGRNNSVHTRAELVELARNQLRSLTPEERKLLKTMLKDSAQGDPALLEYVDHSRWVRKPVSVKQFIEDPYYMGTSSQTLYPRIREDLAIMFETPGIREVVLTGSIGYGKTTFLSFAICRMLYELSCLRQPQLAYGLSPGSEIVIALISKSLYLARTIMKSAVDDKLKLSPYFRDHFPFRIAKDQTIFPENIVLSIGSYYAERMIGANVLGGAMDETNFVTSRGKVMKGQDGKPDSVANYDLAEKMYSSIVRRIKSRFLKAPQDLPGLMVLASSATTNDSFTARKIKASEHDAGVFCRDYAAWDVKPKENFSGGKFWVLIGSKSIRSRIIRSHDEVAKFDANWLESNVARVVEIPIEYIEDFERDLENAIRDIAGLSTHAISPFISRIECIDRCVNTSMRHPFTTIEFDMGSGAKIDWSMLTVPVKRRLPGGYTELGWKPKVNASIGRWVHVDPSLSGDSTGIAIGHISKWVEVARRNSDGEEYQDFAPHIVIDFMLRINPPSGEQIFLPDVRAIVYDFMAHGFNIKGFSCDSYQSAEMVQQMKSHGVYRSGVLSVDRTMEPYDALRSALYEGRIEFYHYEVLMSELRALEYDRSRGKVDHPIAGTKDVADAVAGVVHSLAKMSGGAMLSPPDQVSDRDDDNDRWIQDSVVMPSRMPADSIETEPLVGNSFVMPFIMG